MKSLDAGICTLENRQNDYENSHHLDDAAMLGLAAVASYDPRQLRGRPG
jgi:hypothetical protein